MFEKIFARLRLEKTGPINHAAGCIYPAHIPGNE